jgi:hypothetical protein
VHGGDTGGPGATPIVLAHVILSSQEGRPWRVEDGRRENWDLREGRGDLI